MSPLWQVFQWQDTVFPNVLLRPLLWLSVLTSVISVVARCAAERDEGIIDGTTFEPIMKVMTESLKMLNWAMVFYMGFYNSVGYSRWMANWECTQVGYGRINDLNVLVPAYMQAKPKLAADVLRFVNAYHHFIYIVATAGHPKEYALPV